MSVNRVIITGNLGADPELRRTQSGMAIMNMRIAVNDRRKNPQTGSWEDYCNWVGATLFGSRAESLANMLHKGSKVAVDGKLRYSEWKNNDGQKHSKLEVIVDDLEFLSPKQQQAQKAPEPQYVEAEYIDKPGTSVYDDEIPFS